MKVWGAKVGGGTIFEHFDFAAQELHGPRVAQPEHVGG